MASDPLGTKRRAFTHVMETVSVKTFASVLPNDWVLRDYKPDYGLDIAVEVFEPIEGKDVSETLGEHFFIQLKSTQEVTVRQIKVASTRERAVAMPSPVHREMTIDCIAFPLETSELRTIEVMGAAAIVHLVLVDLSQNRCYFVCLNDYIDAVLTRDNPAWRQQGSNTIYIPTRNFLSAADDRSLAPIRFYAKRAKLLAAFQRFSLDAHEVSWWMADVQKISSDPHEADDDAVIGMCRFARRSSEVMLRWDFWEQLPIWGIIYDMYARLRHVQDLLRAWGEPYSADTVPRELLLSEDSGWRLFAKDLVNDMDPQELRMFALTRVVEVWNQLANLPRIYEEVCRTWFLPHYEGYALSDLRMLTPEV